MASQRFQILFDINWKSTRRPREGLRINKTKNWGEANATDSQAEAWEIVRRISSISSRDVLISEVCFYDHHFASTISQGSQRFKEGRREMRTLVEVVYRIAIATKGRETRKRIARPTACVHCLMRVSFIKRSNRACYVSCMKISADESRDEESLVEFLCEKMRGVGLFW
jgi:hypothetical protein